jgi:hypothetical protein
MEKILEAGAWLAAHGPDVVSALVAVLSGVIGISLLIPGEQPEAALQKTVAWLSKFSRKKPE